MSGKLARPDADRRDKGLTSGKRLISRRWRTLTGISATTVLLLVLSACSSGDGSTVTVTSTAVESLGAATMSASSSQSTSPQSLSSQAASSLIANAGAGTALATLGTLVVKASTDSVAYDAAAFGVKWADTDNNNCDTRNDILARDLTNTTVDATCAILTGKLVDP